MDFIYPKNGSSITLTKGFNGKTNELILKLAHAKPETEVYWYIDETFVGQTRNFHEMAVLPSKGNHTVMVLDAYGNEIAVSISIQ